MACHRPGLFAGSCGGFGARLLFVVLPGDGITSAVASEVVGDGHEPGEQSPRSSHRSPPIVQAAQDGLHDLVLSDRVLREMPTRVGCTMRTNQPRFFQSR